MVQLSGHHPITVFSVDCLNIYDCQDCHCCFCKRIVEFYICLYHKRTPCYNREKFQNFKSFCKHLESEHRTKIPFKSNPAKASSIGKFYCKTIPRWWSQCLRRWLFLWMVPRGPKGHTFANVTYPQTLELPIIVTSNATLSRRWFVISKRYIQFWSQRQSFVANTKW